MKILEDRDLSSVPLCPRARHGALGLYVVLLLLLLLSIVEPKGNVVSNPTSSFITGENRGPRTQIFTASATRPSMGRFELMITSTLLQSDLHIH